MKKKIIISALVFIGAFVISSLAFIPLGGVASKYIAEAAAKNSVDLKFDRLDIGFFGAQMTNIKSGVFAIDKLNLKYNPVGLLFRRVSFNAESPFFIAGGKIAGSTVTADIKGSVAALAGLAKFSGSGSLDLKGTYNLTTGEGSLDLSSGAVSFAHPLMNVEADSISGNAGIKGNIITIGNISAKGKTSLEGKGSVLLNTNKPEFSTLDIEGTAGLMGMNMNFKLQGAAGAPRFITQ